MATTPRQRARERTMDEIVRIGREHLATEGAAALSLRAVARDLGVVSSAIYRYVASRDELLTLLVIDAYGGLADEVDAALARRSLAPLDEVAEIARAVRTWARREPARYALLYGSPVPGYHAPADRTTEPGTRVAARLIGALADADPARRSPEPGPAPVEGRLGADLTAVAADLGHQVDPAVMATGLLAWNAVLGAISAEVFGWYGPEFEDTADQLFEYQLGGVLEMLERAGVRPA